MKNPRRFVGGVRDDRRERENVREIFCRDAAACMGLGRLATRYEKKSWLEFSSPPPSSSPKIRERGLAAC
jgi:hypothetical protein